MTTMKKTTITVSVRNRDRLLLIGSKTETYDDIISRVLDSVPDDILVAPKTVVRKS